MSIDYRLLLAASFFSAVSVCVEAFASKTAAPPQPQDITGVWIGVEDDGIDFVRLDLRLQGNGYCATVAPKDSDLHKIGAHVYKIGSWKLSQWSVVVECNSIAEPKEQLVVKGRFDGTLLDATIGSKNGDWHKALILYRESRLNESNSETSESINAVEKKNN